MRWTMPNDNYYTSKRHRDWRSKVIQRAGGLCEECKRYGRVDADGLPIAATIAHHIKPRECFPGLQFAVANGRALCAACHNAEHPEKGRGTLPNSHGKR